MESVARSVTETLSRFGLSSGLAPIVDAWPEAVGPEIARNAWPARVARDGTLMVHTSSSAWAFELGLLEARITASLGAVAPPKLRFVVGPLPEPAAPSAHAARPRPRPSPLDVEQAQALAAGIGDENLRKVVAKAASLSLAACASDRSF
jgi:hypothetical protein